MSTPSTPSAPEQMRAAVAHYVELAGAVAGLEWTLRFFDPVVLPELALIDESGEPAFAEVRHALGVRTVVYHFVASPGAGLPAHQAAHVGTGLAGGHSAAARDFETIRGRVRGREDLVDEMAGAAAAGLVRAHAMLAAAVVPNNAQLRALASDRHPDPDAVRRELLAAVGGRTQWQPPAVQEPPAPLDPPAQPDPPAEPAS